MANNATTKACTLTTAQLALSDSYFNAIYHIITPLYFIIGMFANSVLLTAFYKQSKTEKGYVYQILVTVSKTMEILNFTIFVFCWKWWQEDEAVNWFKQSYAITWYTAYLSQPLMNGFITSTLFLSLSMTADRISALARPIKYRLMNHKIYHILTAVVCFTVGFATTLFHAFRYKIDWNGEFYKISGNQEMINLPINLVLAQVRTAVRMVGLAGLITLNMVMLISFRRRARKVAQMTNRDQKEKKTDNTLLILTVWQSILTCFAIAPITVYYVLTQVAPVWSDCWYKVLAASVDGSLAIADSIDIFVVMTISRKCRKMIFHALSCFRCRSKDDLATISQTQSNPTGYSRQTDRLTVG